MGTLGKRGKPKQVFTEESIQRYLWLRKPLLTNPLYEALNLFFYDWESDYLALSRNGYVYEAEIKVSRTDFKADLRKPKHEALRTPGARRPNYFCYVCPEGVATEEDLKDIPYAGLIIISDGGWLSQVTPLPCIHGEKHPFTDMELAGKFHYGMWNFIKRYWAKETVDISAAARKRYENQLMEYDDMLSQKDDEIWGLNRQINRLEEQLKKAGLNKP